MKAKRPPASVSIAAVFISCVTLTGLAWSRGNSDRERTDRTVCALVSQGAADERRSLAAYDREPPTSDVGRAQQQAARESLAGYVELARAQGCSPESERS